MVKGGLIRSRWVDEGLIHSRLVTMVAAGLVLSAGLAKIFGKQPNPAMTPARAWILMLQAFALAMVVAIFFHLELPKCALFFGVANVGLLQGHLRP